MWQPQLSLRRCVKLLLPTSQLSTPAHWGDNFTPFYFHLKLMPHFLATLYIANSMRGIHELLLICRQGYPVIMPRTKRQCMKWHWFLCLGVGFFGFGRAVFVLGFRVLAFCHWRFVPRSQKVMYELFVTLYALLHASHFIQSVFASQNDKICHLQQNTPKPKHRIQSVFTDTVTSSLIT